MPRPREFDETAALEAAIECFWRHGYEATSLRHLTAPMGLTAPNLYNAFGDKQQLFSRALERAYSTSESFAERAAARRNNPTTIISAIKLPVNVSRAASASGFWLSGKSFDRRSDGSRR